MKLRTVYFYFYFHLGDEYKKNVIRVIIGNKFPTLLRNCDRVSRATTHKSNNPFSSDEFLIKLKGHLIIYQISLTFPEYLF